MLITKLAKSKTVYNGEPLQQLLQQKICANCF